MALFRHAPILLAVHAGVVLLLPDERHSNDVRCGCEPVYECHHLELKSTDFKAIMQYLNTNKHESVVVVSDSPARLISQALIAQCTMARTFVVT